MLPNILFAYPQRCLPATPRVYTDSIFVPWRPKDTTQQAIEYCARWGVSVLVMAPFSEADLQMLFDESDDYGQDKSPGSPDSNAGIFMPERQIYLNVDRAAEDENQLGFSLIHELSHCLQSGHPDSSDEVESSMLAFEYFSHLYLSYLPAQRAKYMRSFQVQVPPEDHQLRTWDELTEAEANGYIERSFVFAREQGLLTDEGFPTFRRPSWMR